MIPLTYGLIAFIIPSPALFNSAKGAEFFDPGIFDNMSDLVNFRLKYHCLQ